MQDEILCFEDVAEGQREAREPCSVQTEEGWHPFLAASPMQEEESWVPESLSAAPRTMPREYVFQALEDLSEDEGTRELVRRTIEHTLDNVLNASDSTEVQDVVQAYWDFVGKEITSSVMQEGGRGRGVRLVCCVKGCYVCELVGTCKLNGQEC